MRMPHEGAKGGSAELRSAKHLQDALVADEPIGDTCDPHWSATAMSAEET